MIKIERNNLAEIANEYYEQMERMVKSTKFDTTNKCHKYYLNLLPEFILCDIDKFDTMVKDFETACEKEIAKTEKAERDYNDYVHNYTGKRNNPQYIQKKKNLENKISKSPYAVFCKDMEKLYESSFRRKVKFTKNKKLTSDNLKLGFWLAKKLDITTCPYCNRTYTFTVKASGTTRPEFDHFRPKSKFPYFALSFYNLVPSCLVCNHLKGDKIINIHPYEKGFGNDYKFQLNPLEIMFENEVSDVKIEPDENNTNVDVFMLNKLYKKHLDYINEIVSKAKAYNADYYNSLIDSFHQLGASPTEINRYIWGCYMDVAEQSKRPLSKLTKDILDQLDIDIL